MKGLGVRAKRGRKEVEKARARGRDQAKEKGREGCHSRKHRSVAVAEAR